MKPVLHKGKLTTWKDDRGFGFVKPEDGGKEVFLHISALTKAGRRPQVGDIILYKPIAQPDGKIRATSAAIQGVAHRTSKPKSQAKPQKLSAIAGLGIGFIAANAIFADITNKRWPIVALVRPNCYVKGNISIANGNKNYHLPGMEDYDSTRIQAEHGERWFCSESEAIAAGWRKAPK